MNVTCYAFIMTRFSSALLFLGVLFFTSPIRADESNWLTDFRKAKQEASIANKPMVLDFTGSDWCGWCIKLDKEVFSTPEFASYAKEKLILVKLDFPKIKPQSETEKRQNNELAEKYKIEGFPTIIVLDSKGKLLGKLGYEPGGPQAFLDHLDKILAGRDNK